MLWKYKSQRGRERTFEGKSVYLKFLTETYSSTTNKCACKQNGLFARDFFPSSSKSFKFQKKDIVEKNQ